MATVTFDTLELVDRLKAAGFESRQTEAMVRVVSKAQDELVTKRDLQVELAPIRADLMLLKWMKGLLLGGVAALVLKTFFPH
ncbi:MAG: DUF1640 domain-containing protein [Magnetococcales bacterium]|nr:DUF1640 domain-containing protein [Magnetococcales bacterium]